jgi:hypothetical protein
VWIPEKIPQYNSKVLMTNESCNGIFTAGKNEMRLICKCIVVGLCILKLSKFENLSCVESEIIKLLFSNREPPVLNIY